MCYRISDAILNPILLKVLSDPSFSIRERSQAVNELFIDCDLRWIPLSADDVIAQYIKIMAPSRFTREDKSLQYMATKSRTLRDLHPEIELCFSYRLNNIFSDTYGPVRMLHSYCTRPVISNDKIYFEDLARKTLSCNDKTGLGLWERYFGEMDYSVGNKKVFVSTKEGSGKIMRFVNPDTGADMWWASAPKATQNDACFIWARNKQESMLYCIVSSIALKLKLPAYTGDLSFTVMANYCIIAERKGDHFTVYDTKDHTWSFEGTLDFDFGKLTNVAIKDDKLYYYGLDGRLVCHHLLKDLVLSSTKTLDVRSKIMVNGNMIVTHGATLSCYSMGAMLWNQPVKREDHIVCRGTKVYVCNDTTVVTYRLFDGKHLVTRSMDDHRKEMVGVFGKAVLMKYALY
jgi:outer membrane protein assembly factor BamB